MRIMIADHCSVCGGLRSLSPFSKGEKLCESKQECLAALLAEVQKSMEPPKPRKTYTDDDPCPDCGKYNTFERIYGGERGESGPWFYCTECGWDEEHQ